MVHLRLLGFVLRDSQIAATIQRLMKVLSEFPNIQNRLNYVLDISKNTLYADAFEQRAVDGYSGANITIQAIQLSRQTVGYPQRTLKS